MKYNLKAKIGYRSKVFEGSSVLDARSGLQKYLRIRNDE
jgi:hypothetical protein